MKFSLLKFLALGLCGISSVNAVNKSEIICSYMKKIEVPADTKLDYCTVIENENGLNLLLRYEADKSLADIFSQTFVFNDQNIMPETRKLFCRIFRDNEDIYSLESGTYYRDRTLSETKITRNACRNFGPDAGGPASDNFLKDSITEQCETMSKQIADPRIMGSGCSYEGTEFRFSYEVSPEPAPKGSIGGKYTERKFNPKDKKMLDDYCLKIRAKNFYDAGFRTMKYIYNVDGKPSFALILDLNDCMKK